MHTWASDRGFGRYWGININRGHAIHLSRRKGQGLEVLFIVDCFHFDRGGCSCFCHRASIFYVLVSFEVLLENFSALSKVHFTIRSQNVFAFFSSLHTF
jgi:hypothetical protein